MPASNLNNLVVFDETLRSATSELLAHNFNLFNTASNGCIVLGTGDFQGDFSVSSFWNNFAAVNHRSPYQDDALTAIEPSMLEDVMVKLGWSAGPFKFTPAHYDWMLINPDEAAGVLAVQLAEKITEMMVNDAVISLIAALLNDTATNINDITSDTTKTANNTALRQTAGLMGDRQTDIRTWIIHSKPMGDLWDAAMANSEQLFNYGTVAIQRDPFGRTFVITDNANLVVDDTTDCYYTLGLKPGAVTVRDGSRQNSNWQTTNGRTNIERTYQVEGDFNMSVAGYAWDRTNGGKAPNQAALAVSTNWNKYVTSHKNLPGVALYSN